MTNPLMGDPHVNSRRPPDCADVDAGRPADHRQPYLPTGKVEEDWRAITLTVDKVEKIIR